MGRQRAVATSSPEEASPWKEMTRLAEQDPEGAYVALVCSFVLEHDAEQHPHEYRDGLAEELRRAGSAWTGMMPPFLKAKISAARVRDPAQLQEAVRRVLVLSMTLPTDSIGRPTLPDLLRKAAAATDDDLVSRYLLALAGGEFVRSSDRKPVPQR